MGHAKRQVSFGSPEEDHLIPAPQQDAVPLCLSEGPFRGELPIALPGDKGRNAVAVDKDAVDGHVQMNGRKGGKIFPNVCL